MMFGNEPSVVIFSDMIEFIRYNRFHAFKFYVSFINENVKCNHQNLRVRERFDYC